MSSSLTTESAESADSATDAERPTKRRLRGRRRAVTFAGVLLALAGIMATDSGTAVAAAPPGACTQWCNNPPPNVSVQNWNWAVEAADFWANHWADTTTTSWYGGRTYYRLDQWAGHGWPGQTFGNRWYAYWDSRLHRDQYVYYGGVYNDYNGLLSNFEQVRGVSSSRAYSTNGRTTAPYVEYDIAYYNAPNTGRDAMRIIRNPNSGNVYATFDHYQSFDYLGHY
ncbi:hypothetical protein OG352_19085 [Streptomyces sp. NBC_01485]|uniref:ribonuclease domain-containing protein n=1 Tax=Streptomyces sp. NBC_01485 TaxID=2903884 RepID=UPI002E344BF6|nr:ribonuclease domain-containing protein [Streptomyces sp. NBC_01485]